MSADTMPCGCLGHADYEDLCQYPALKDAAVKAAAELRHAYRAHGLGHGPIDPGLVSRAIQILERATGGTP